MQQDSKQTYSRTAPGTRGLTNSEYGSTQQDLPDKGKDSKGMLALGNQGTGIQESKFLLQKSLLKYVLTFNILFLPLMVH
jgi:hypothetical protein